MFKFVRYFFIVFLVTTITPLLLLFAWNEHQFESFKDKTESRILETEITRLKYKLEQAEDLSEQGIMRLHPDGPFTLEVYKGGEIAENALVKRISPPVFPQSGVEAQTKDFPSKILSHDGFLFVLKLHPRPRADVLQDKVVQPGFIILAAGIAMSLMMGVYVNKNFNLMLQGLKEKEQLKESFIENMTHDLRTPLVAQEKALGLLADEFENVGMREQFNLAKGLEKNNKHLLRMVNLILESYRIDLEKINIKISNINIGELVNSCFEKLGSVAKEKNILLLNNIPDDFPEVSSDLVGLKRVLINLISNSLENIPENSQIEINAEHSEKYVRILVEDNGQGIAAEEIEHIFDRYYSGKTDERKIGSGLGLYVCRKLLEFLNGEITVESEKGKFTRFIIRLAKEN